MDENEKDSLFGVNLPWLDDFQAYYDELQHGDVGDGAIIRAASVRVASAHPPVGVIPRDASVRPIGNTSNLQVLLELRKMVIHLDNSRMLTKQSGLVKRVKNIDDLQPGDHICYWRPYLYEHHAIFIRKVSEEKMEIIEYAREDKNSTRLQILLGGKCKIQNNIVPFRQSDAYIKGPMYKVIYTGEPEIPFVVLFRANRYKINFKNEKYHILTNNCEHFANWCKTGHHKSVQAKQLRRILFRGLDYASLFIITSAELMTFVLDLHDHVRSVTATTHIILTATEFMHTKHEIQNIEQIYSEIKDEDKDPNMKEIYQYGKYLKCIFKPLFGVVSAVGLRCLFSVCGERMFSRNLKLGHNVYTVADSVLLCVIGVMGHRLGKLVGEYMAHVLTYRCAIHEYLKK